MIKKCHNFCKTHVYDSIIIDVRGNIGGCVDIMCRFLKYVYGVQRCRMWIFKSSNNTKYVIQSQGKLRYVSESEYRDTPAVHSDKSIYILINRGTQSAAEMCVAAFVDRPNVVFVGEQSGGLMTENEFYFINKQIVQRSHQKYVVSKIPNKHTLIAFNLTVSEVLKHNGQSFENNAIKVDIESTKALEYAIVNINKNNNIVRNVK